jgi:hypothetical protein
MPPRPALAALLRGCAVVPTGLVAALVACGPTATPSPAAPTTVAAAAPADPQRQFWAALGALCGQAFAGAIVANDGGGAGPDPFEGKPLRMHVRSCSDDEIRVPFHVGDDRSRTWVFTRRPGGLRLEHDHRHADGSDDAVTMYGGDTTEPGSATEQRFPSNPFTRALFVRQGLERSVPNVWVIELLPGRTYGYALTRPGRHFRVDFDLTAPIEPPPPPWGSE